MLPFQGRSLAKCYKQKRLAGKQYGEPACLLESFQSRHVQWSHKHAILSTPIFGCPVHGTIPPDKFDTDERCSHANKFHPI